MLQGLISRAIEAGGAYRVDTDELLDGVLPDIGNRSAKASAFWILLVCSSIIAAAGVISDSTAVVIGAMVIAPLGTPIYGIAAALTAGIRVRPVLLRLLGGILVCITIGALVDLATIERFALETNPQILGRTNPSIVDLLVAGATGIAGSLALVRTDISPALPGVAIAISLVPPLTVVGITAVNGEFGLATGALLLFATNMFAIILAGMVVFTGAKLTAPTSAALVHSRRSTAVLTLGFIIVTAMLAVGTADAIRTSREDAQIRAAAERYDRRTKAWRLVSIERAYDTVVVTYVGDGTEPAPAIDSTSEALAGIRRGGSTVVVEFETGSRIDL